MVSNVNDSQIMMMLRWLGERGGYQNQYSQYMFISGNRPKYLSFPGGEGVV